MQRCSMSPAQTAPGADDGVVRALKAVGNGWAAVGFGSDR